MSRLKRDDAGFTLMELLMAMVIMGIITVPLGNFMLSYLKNFQTTQNRISDSHDILMTSAFFSQDVANTGLHQTASPFNPVQSVWTGAAPPASYCGQGAGVSLVLLLSWDVYTPTTANGSTSATYSQSSAAYVSTSGVMKRIFCASGTNTTTTATLVHGYQGASVSCSTTCTAATPPNKITLTLTIATSSTNDQAKPNQPVTLNGQRRQT